MAAIERDRAPLAARPRRPRGGALQRPARAVLVAGGGAQHSDRLAHDPRTVFSLPEAADRAALAQATGGDDAEKPAAASRRRFGARRPGGGDEIPPGAAGRQV